MHKSTTVLFVGDSAAQKILAPRSGGLTEVKKSVIVICVVVLRATKMNKIANKTPVQVHSQDGNARFVQNRVSCAMLEVFCGSNAAEPKERQEHSLLSRRKATVKL